MKYTIACQSLVVMKIIFKILLASPHGVKFISHSYNSESALPNNHSRSMYMCFISLSNSGVENIKM